MASSSVALGIETLVDLLLYRCQQSPERIAYEFLETEEGTTACLTYQELDIWARRIAIVLQSRGLAGERVLLFYQPGLEYIAALFGCLYAGAIAVPTYPPHGPKKLARLYGIVINAEASLVLTTQSILAKIDGRLESGTQLSRLEWLPTDTLSGDPSAWQVPTIHSDALAFLQYTSGSTGVPKGVMISHGNLLHNLELIYRCFGHSDRSQGVIWLPLYHDMGLIGGILQPIYGGFPVALMPPHFLRNPLQWLQMISRYRATTSGAPNFAYRLCVEKAKTHDLQDLDLSSWEVAFNGAEPIRTETLQGFAKSFAPYGFNATAFYPCYGMAESTLFVTGGNKFAPAITRAWDRAALERGEALPANSILENPCRLVSCGHTHLGQQVIIVAPDTRHVCGDRVVGEIWITGPSVAQGYWNRSKATQQVFHAYLADNKTGPFLRTGDLGFLDNHELFVTGRLKDLLIVQGRNHYPHDIEFTVEQSHPALHEKSGAAIVVEMKGEERLVVIQEVDYSYLRQLDRLDVINTIRSAIIYHHQLAPYAIILVKTGSVAKTSSGKVKRYACRVAFLSGSLAVVDDWTETPRHRTKFRLLKSDVNSMLEQLTN